MNEGVWLGPYIARRKLRIPQGPGKTPSSVRFFEKDVFSFDGDERVDIRMLLRTQAIQPYSGELENLEAT
jgi:hypothetical protein